MANYTTMSLSATKYLCGLIRDLASVSEAIDDLHITSTGTFSSVMIDTLIKKCLEDANEYTEKLVANLSRLELKLVTSESEITQPNILYLFKPDGATSYNQYVVIEGNKVLLGTCDIDMAQYLKIADASKTYATKTELKAVTDKIGTTTLTTTAQTLTGSIEEVKGIAEQGALLTVTKEQYQQLVAGQTVNIDGKDYTYDDNTYYVVKNDGDTIVTTSTINASSTNSEVPTAKAINVECKYGRVINNDVIATYGTEISKYPVGKWVIYRNDMATQFTDLPTKAACRINIYGLLDNNFTPFNNSWQYRMITVTDINGKLYTREFNSGNTAGVFEQDTGWQRVVTTKVDDVPKTNIPFPSITGLNINVSEIYYIIKNGWCNVNIYFGATSPSYLNWTILSTNLPKPYSLVTDALKSDFSNSPNVLLQIDNGTLKIMVSEAIPKLTTYYCNISYPVAES